MTIQDHKDIVTFGDIKFENGKLKVGTFSATQDGQKILSDEVRSIIRNGTFTIVEPDNADFILSSTPDRTCGD